MKVFLLTALTMVAFAANSLLNRAALAEGDIGPGAFALIRVLAGAVVLVLLVALRDKGLRAPRPNWGAVASLSAYMLGFSYAYIQLDAGLGALILFAGVQVTMFAGAVLGGERPHLARWTGMVLALAGLALLVWPDEQVALPPASVALMAVAAVGWGVYSLIGRGIADPLAATAANFLYTLPAVLLIPLVAGGLSDANTKGIVLATISGGVTSGMGYALWYSLLPRLGATKAALSQLSAPVIAVVAGAILLGEAVTLKAALASALILGGIALGVVWPQLTMRSNGS
jgi:drug/metabolite transporter (DMT)-like permease